MRNIAKVLNVDSAIITRNIKKLEDLKYVIKLKSDNDNRTFDLCLTDKGLDIFKLLNQYHHKWYEKITNNFNEEEISDLINMLNKLCSNI